MSDASPVLVVLPTYNERDNLKAHVEEILGLGERYRVLVVDDNSPDGTGDLADRLAAAHPGRLSVLHRQAKEGLGRAYVAGFTVALATGAPLIAQMDADRSHRPEDLARLVEAIGAVDLVLGSRYIPGGSTSGWPWHRKAISRAGSAYASLILGVPIRDLTGGFKLWRRETLEAIDLETIRSDGYCFQIETTMRAMRGGKQIRQVPIHFVDRVAGKSKLSRRVVFEAAVKVWVLRFQDLRHRRARQRPA